MKMLTWDLLGGGLIAHKKKRSRLGDARKLVALGNDQLEMGLNKLKEDVHAIRV